MAVDKKISPSKVKNKKNKVHKKGGPTNVASKPKKTKLKAELIERPSSNEQETTVQKAEEVDVNNNAEIISYSKIMEIVEKPYNKREEIFIQTLNKKIIPRRHHASEKKRIKIIEKAEKIGKFPNPFSRGGCCHGIHEALIELGINDWHELPDVIKKTEEIMITITNSKGESAWIAFRDKPVRNSNTGKDWRGRILQNIQVYQRLESGKRRNLSPYGKKLSQFNCCYDLKRDSTGQIFVRLNTKWEKEEGI